MSTLSRGSGGAGTAEAVSDHSAWEFDEGGGVGAESQDALEGGAASAVGASRATHEAPPGTRKKRSQPAKPWTQDTKRARSSKFSDRTCCFCNVDGSAASPGLTRCGVEVSGAKAVG